MEKEETLSRIAEVMNVLGVESRLKIVLVLKEHESLCVNARARRLGISQSGVSQHLKILHYSGFVSSSRDGYYTHYSLERQALEDAVSLISSISRCTLPLKGNDCKQKGGKKCAETKKNAKSLKT